MNPVLIGGALLGLLSVILGAAAEHWLGSRVEPATMASVATAVRYHQFAALVITGIGLALLAHVPTRTARFLRLSAAFFLIGAFLFSFSIYLSAFTGIAALGRVTPLGGISLMLGWLVLAWAGWVHRDASANNA